MVKRNAADRAAESLQVGRETAPSSATGTIIEAIDDTMMRGTATATALQRRLPGVVAIVLAGGAGTRLHPLTAEQAKPALPLAGRRVVDFVLSNLVNSGIGTIYVLAQYKPTSLAEHIETEWRPALLRAGGLLETVLPAAGERFLGTADAVYRCLHLVERHAPELVAVFAADHVYRMDVGQMAAFHWRARAAITLAAVPVPVPVARRLGVIVAAAGGRVEDFQEKPAAPAAMRGQPTRAFASMGNYLFDPEALARLLEEAHQRGENDFGADVLPRALRTHRMFAYNFADNRIPGLRAFEDPVYWRDIGTLEAYDSAHRDLCGACPRLVLANDRWPIGANAAQRLAGRSNARGCRSREMTADVDLHRVSAGAVLGACPRVVAAGCRQTRRSRT